MSGKSKSVKEPLPNVGDEVVVFCWCPIAVRISRHSGRVLARWRDHDDKRTWAVVEIIRKTTDEDNRGEYYLRGCVFTTFWDRSCEMWRAVWPASERTEELLDGDADETESGMNGPSGEDLEDFAATLESDIQH